MDNYEPKDVDTKDPRISTTRIICARRKPAVPRFIAWPAMSSLLFLFSALCLLFGAWTVFASLADDQLQLLERFGMVGAVHGYELALVAVAVLLCRFQKFNPDAIGPVLLGACFCVGSAVTLDLVSIDAPVLTLLCGLVGVIFTIAKGRALTWIHTNAQTLTWTVIVVGLVVMNLLWPGIMGIQRDNADSGLYTQWWYVPAWATMLMCALFIVIGVLRTGDISSDKMRPFLRREALRWTVALVLVGCSVLHLVVLGYLHNLDVTTGEFIPFLAVIAIGAVDLRHRAMGSAPLLDTTFLLLPIIAAMCAVLGDDTGILSNPRGDGSLFNPAVVMGLYALALFTMWYRNGYYNYAPLALLAMASTVLIWHVEPSLTDFNWLTTAALFSVMLISVGCYRQAPRLLAVSSYLVAATAYAYNPDNAWLTTHALNPLLTWIVFGNMVAVFIMAWNPQAFSRWEIRLTIALTTISLLIISTPITDHFTVPGIAAFLIVISHSAIFWRTRDIMSLVPAIIPLFMLSPHMMPTHKGWIAVMAAFALLAIGTVVSYLRVHRQKKSKPQQPISSPTPVTVTALEPISV